MVVSASARKLQINHSSSICFSSGLMNTIFHFRGPILSEQCQFAVVCKWHWLSDVNSHFSEETPKSFCVPNRDSSAITKPPNTHNTHITDDHISCTSGCNSFTEPFLLIRQLFSMTKMACWEHFHFVFLCIFLQIGQGEGAEPKYCRKC